MPSGPTFCAKALRVALLRHVDELLGDCRAVGSVSLREFVYGGAAVAAFLLILCITAFAQDSHQFGAAAAFRSGHGPEWRRPERLANQNGPRPERSIASTRTAPITGPFHRGERNQPGQFDFYVLALSWSPSFCEASRERGQGPLAAAAMRQPPLFLRGAWPVAAT